MHTIDTEQSPGVPLQAAEVHVSLLCLICSRRAIKILHVAAGGHVLALGSGTNILGLMAAQLGARRITCIEQGPMLFRMAKQTLQSNAHVTGAKHIVLVDRHLQACGIVGMYPFQRQQALLKAYLPHSVVDHLYSVFVFTQSLLTWSLVTQAVSPRYAQVGTSAVCLVSC